MVHPGSGSACTWCSHIQSPHIVMLWVHVIDALMRHHGSDVSCSGILYAEIACSGIGMLGLCCGTTVVGCSEAIAFRRRVTDAHRNCGVAWILRRLQVGTDGPVLCCLQQKSMIDRQLWPRQEAQAKTRALERGGARRQWLD